MKDELWLTRSRAQAKGCNPLTARLHFTLHRGEGLQSLEGAKHGDMPWVDKAPVPVAGTTGARGLCLREKPQQPTGCISCSGEGFQSLDGTGAFQFAPKRRVAAP